MKIKKKNKKMKNNKKKKRTPAPPENVRPNSFVPRAPKGTYAGESSLASTKCHCLLRGRTPSSTSRKRTSGASRPCSLRLSRAPLLCNRIRGPAHCTPPLMATSVLVGPLGDFRVSCAVRPVSVAGLCLFIPHAIHSRFSTELR